MLIEKRNAPDIGDVVTIKLASGEEIVGRMTDRTTDTISLAKPVQIVMQQISAQQVGLAFHPVLGSVNEQSPMQFVLALLAIRPLKTGEDVTASYIKATSGLLTAGHLPSLTT